jgi:ribonuclease G
MDLALRLVRDVFSEEFERLVVDDKATHTKIVSFLKKTSPELVRRVSCTRTAMPLFDAYVACSRHHREAMRRVVELPSGGHIAIDKTEALTAIDVNTGQVRRAQEPRGHHRAGSTSRQPRRSLAAAQTARYRRNHRHRLHRHGGAGNRAAVTSASERALERDRTKTRVLEISRLGLVEMTRKNVTDGTLRRPDRAVCPCCGGEGAILSRQTRRIAVERTMREILRALSGRLHTCSGSTRRRTSCSPSRASTYRRGAEG